MKHRASCPLKFYEASRFVPRSNTGWSPHVGMSVIITATNTNVKEHRRFYLEISKQNLRYLFTFASVTAKFTARRPSCRFSASEMTYIVSSGALNSTHSLLQSQSVYVRRSDVTELSIGLQLHRHVGGIFDVNDVNKYWVKCGYLQIVMQKLCRPCVSTYLLTCSYQAGVRA